MIPIYIGRGKSILHIKTPDFHYSGGDMDVNIASSINTRWQYGCNYRTLNKSGGDMDTIIVVSIICIGDMDTNIAFGGGSVAIWMQLSPFQ